MKTFNCSVAFVLVLPSLLVACGPEGSPPTGIYTRAIIEDGSNCPNSLPAVDAERDVVVADARGYAVSIPTSKTGGARFKLKTEDGYLWTAKGIEMSREDTPTCKRLSRDIRVQLLASTSTSLDVLYREDWDVEGVCDKRGQPKSCVQDRVVRYTLVEACSVDGSLSSENPVCPQL